METRIYLFDCYGDSYRVDGALNEDPLLLVSADSDWGQQQLLATPGETEREQTNEGMKGEGMKGEGILTQL